MIADLMLAAKLETSKTATAQCAPKFFFFSGLVAAEIASDVFEAHAEMVENGWEKYKSLKPIE